MKSRTTVQRAIDAAGGMRALARALGISHQTIGQWRVVPAMRTHAVEAATGISRSELRPDLYPPEREKRVNSIKRSLRAATKG